jgi:hypothetical protein
MPAKSNAASLGVEQQAFGSALMSGPNKNKKLPMIPQSEPFDSPDD